MNSTNIYYDHATDSHTLVKANILSGQQLKTSSVVTDKLSSSGNNDIQIESHLRLKDGKSLHALYNDEHISMHNIIHRIEQLENQIRKQIDVINMSNEQRLGRLEAYVSKLDQTLTVFENDQLITF